MYPNIEQEPGWVCQAATRFCHLERTTHYKRLIQLLPKFWDRSLRAILDGPVGTQPTSGPLRTYIRDMIIHLEKILRIDIGGQEGNANFASDNGVWLTKAECLRFGT